MKAIYMMQEQNFQQWTPDMSGAFRRRLFPNESLTVALDRLENWIRTFGEI